MVTALEVSPATVTKVSLGCAAAATFTAVPTAPGSNHNVCSFKL